MNYIWCLMIIVSIVVSIFNGTVDQTINGAFEGAKSAVFTVFFRALPFQWLQNGYRKGDFL